MVSLVHIFTSLTVVILQISAKQHVAFPGDTVNLTFSLGSSVSSTWLTWQKENERLLNHDFKSNEVKWGKYSSHLDKILMTAWLEIPDVTYEDAGEYSCTVYKPFKGTNEEYEWGLLILGEPRLSLENNTSNEYDLLTASCCTNVSLPQWNVQFVWMIGDNVRFPRNESQTGNMNQSTDLDMMTVCSTIWFQSLRRYNNRQLLCFLDGYRSKNSNEILQVTYVPVIKIEVSPCSSANSELLIYADQDINVTCISDGTEEALVYLEYYEKDEWKTITNITRSSSTNSFNTISWNFHIRATNKQPSEKYRCSAENSFKRTSIREELKVELLYPLAVLAHTSMKVANGHDINMSCVISDMLTPDVKLQKLFNKKQWLTLESKATSDGSKGTNTTWTFIFQNVTPDIQGSYRCFATAEYGRLVVSQPQEVQILTNKLNRSHDHQFLKTYVKVVVFACIFGIALPPASYILTCYTIQLWKGRTRRRASFQERGSLETCTPEFINLPDVTDCPSSSSIKPLSEDTGKEVLAQDLVFIRALDTGTICKRWVGKLQKDDGSEKCVQILQPTAADADAFAEWNCHIGGLLRLEEHRNIISTIGFSVVASTAYCIQDATSNESVRSYIKRNSKQLSCDTYSIFDLPNLFISFAMDIIRGVKFLNSNKWLHPGLCMDKLLLAKDGQYLKLYDFCRMSIAVKALGTYKAKADNVLFLAPEVILKNEYTFKSELWAIGITFWEIFSSGKNIPLDAHKTEHLKIYQKLDQLGSCPFPVFQVIKPCWSLDPKTRPSLEELEEALLNLQNEYHCIQFDTQDDKVKDETDSKGEFNNYVPHSPTQ